MSYKLKDMLRGKLNTLIPQKWDSELDEFVPAEAKPSVKIIESIPIKTGVEYPNTYPSSDTILEIDKITTGTRFSFADSITGTLWGRPMTVPDSTKLTKSVNNGDTWTEVYDFGGSRITKCFVTKTGAILVLWDNTTTNTKIMRSGDGGITFTEVYDFGYWTEVLENSWCEHPTLGVFFGEYRIQDSATNPADIILIKSSNDGVTWTIAKSWTHAYPTSTAGSVRHVHLVQYDPWQNYVWVSTGDSDEQIHNYYTSDGINFVDIGGGSQNWRTTCFIFDRTYIYMLPDGGDPLTIDKIQRHGTGYAADANWVKTVVGNVPAICMYGVMLSNGQILAFTNPRNISTEDNFIRGYLVGFDNLKEIVRLQAQLTPQGGNDIWPLYVKDDYVYAGIRGAYPATSLSFVFVRFKVREVRPFEIIK